MSSNETAAYWNSIADLLSSTRMSTLSSEQSIYWEKVLTDIIPKEPPLRILDIGTGSGFLAVMLSRLGHEVVGIDISPVMIQCAYETASAFGQRIEFRIMDSGDLDFADQSFDAVVCCELLSHLPDLRPTLDEAKRVLKNDGILVVFDNSELTTGQLLARGFSHCRFRDVQDLDALNRGETLTCLSARKPTRNENEDLPQVSLLRRYMQTAKKLIQLYQNWCKGTDLPYPEFSVLNFVSRHARGARPSDISTALVVPPQTLTRILAGLEEAGYLSREISSRDRRSSMISLTDEGYTKIRPLQLALREIEESALTSFDSDDLADMSVFDDRLFQALESAFSSVPDSE